MDNERGITPALQEQFTRLGIDEELTLHILRAYNSGRYDSVEPVHVSRLPEVDGRTIIDLTSDIVGRFPAERLRALSEDTGIELEDLGHIDGTQVVLGRRELEELGVRLYPTVAYGVLNGGSATSYTDITKNRAFSETIFDICAESFERVAEVSTGRAKGITPAFVHPDGTPGPSYVELKMRSLLIEELRYRALRPRSVRSESKDDGILSPMFQMTSVNNDAEIRRAYEGYRDSPLLRGLIDATGSNVTNVLGQAQPMIAAYTHERDGRPKRLFTNAYGEEGRLLPLPGGHGQNFQVLAPTYRELYRRGKRFVILGNVDNLGNVLDPVEIAFVALSGKQAGFDFAFKTPVDVKGGILVVDQHGRLDCADIGPAISQDEVLAAEATGTPILFNCATGIFDLRYLVENLDSIVENLPMRWSNQVKDAGAYAQAEQVTWEIIGMLDDFYVFGVEKYSRFLAAKLLVEGLMTSGVGLEDPRYPTDSEPPRDLKRIAENLHRGLQRRLSGSYGMRLEGGRWVPLELEELEKGLSTRHE